MGREIRRVTPDWQHPRDARGHYIPLHDLCYASMLAEWEQEKAAWERGEFPSWADEASRKLTFEEWNGPRPDAARYMPQWSEAEATHYQMYEDTSEGTPVSPVFATPEEVARYCADNKVSAFAGETASYEAWLRVARGGWAPSAVMSVGPDGRGTLASGVEALTKDPP